MDATIYTDGAARGNPGPAAAAFVIEQPGRSPVEHAEKIGIATNNVAEYTALILALERAAALQLRRVDVRSDSELMVKQFNGEYSVKNSELKELYAEARAMARRLDTVTVSHVRRAENRRADQLCNAVLDGRPPAAGPAARPRPKPKGAPARNAAVDEQAIACLRAALAAGPTAATPEQVWDQLWSVLEEGGVLKARRAK
ncbi:MAG TPA: ribonuclease HI family protein [Gemmataceae bacterium]|jgi:ribonuclease HI|nr:ribonuclease HI family protein [Gemmataceae bacterium]